MNGTGVQQIEIDRAAAARLMTRLGDIVAAASAAVLAIDRATVTTTGKADGSPLTAADLAADRIIAEGLAQLAPEVPVISEERIGERAGETLGSFFIVDPIDGTKEFLGGHDDYTINVALITAGRPLLGIVAAPALGLVWRGLVGGGADRLALSPDGALRADATPIHTRQRPKEQWIAGVSRSHCDSRTDAFIAAMPGVRRQVIGSALKFCRLAEGAIDIYPRLAPVSEWDIAAGHAVVEAAGGQVTDAKGRPLRFRGDPAAIAVPDFIAWADPAMVPH